MNKTFSAGGIVVNGRGEVLVVNQNGNSWSLPKGHIDPGETAAEAAARETREESGIIELNFIRVLGTYERYQIGLDGNDNKNELKQITIFLYTTPQTELRPEDPHNPEARWVKPDEVARLLTHPKDKDFYMYHLPEVRNLIKKL